MVAPAVLPILRRWVHSRCRSLNYTRANYSRARRSLICGGWEIRTPEGITTLPRFQHGALDRYANPPSILFNATKLNTNEPFRASAQCAFQQVGAS